MANLTNSDIIKGSAMQIWLGTDTEPVAFATEHSFSINIETVDISTKSHGDFAATLPQRITWTCSASNLVCDDGLLNYYQKTIGMSKVHVKFAYISNYAGYEDPSGAEKGIVGEDNEKTWTVGATIAEGDALITSLEINASAGDNGTCTIQLQGMGSLTSDYDPTGTPTGTSTGTSTGTGN